MENSGRLRGLETSGHSAAISELGTCELSTLLM